MTGTTSSLRYWPVAAVPPPCTSNLVALEPTTSTVLFDINPPALFYWMATSSRCRNNFGILCGGPAGGRTNTHHRPADNVARSQLVEVFVDLIEADVRDRVLDLPFGGEGHDLAEVRVVAPERPVKSLLARHPREERDVNAIADETNIGVVTADPQQGEAQLHHLRRA